MNNDALGDGFPLQTRYFHAFSTFMSVGRRVNGPGEKDKLQAPLTPGRAGRRIRLFVYVEWVWVRSPRTPWFTRKTFIMVKQSHAFGVYVVFDPHSSFPCL